ncbi:MAG: hypothetical protein DMG32_12375 [Acidobacteria bacterium]|nr:MAG: hypothetical protein DMG32_12375 [Acidobacteriota bacterium]
MFFSPRSVVGLSKDRLARRMVAEHIAPMALLLVVAMLMAGSVRAQQASVLDSDKQTIELLVRRIDQLEARIAQLESGKSPASGATATAAASPPAEPARAAQEPPTEPSEPQRADLSKTLLNIRGFGDITFHRDTAKGEHFDPGIGTLTGNTTSFSLGQLDMFVTSDISDRFKFLSEIVFEAGLDNSFGVDVERYLLQYSPSDYFNVSVGRYHTAIGYYNTAYHHSTWLQTTTGRPFLFAFEDSGGILPIHNVGVSATGLIPSGGLGLHYVAEVGNGRSSSSPNVEAVQNRVDENSGKSFNLALYVRPSAVRGLQAGFSVYHDHLTPIGLPNISENIFAVHAIFIRPSFEWLNETLLVRHALNGTSRVFETPGFYTQLSKRFGSYRPYFRYQYVNASDVEPVFPQVGLMHGPSFGLRYDPSESVTLKLQYDYTDLRHQTPINGVATQLGFTF